MQALPALFWDDGHWLASIILDAWVSFARKQSSEETDDQMDTKQPDSIRLIIMNSAQKPVLPTKEQVNAYQYLFNEQESIKEQILEAIFEEYLKRLEKDTNYNEKLLPEINHPDELEMLVKLSSVRILSEFVDDIAEVEFQFDCVWEDKCGLTILTHPSCIRQIRGV